jgi:hypothetical protein
VNRAFAPIVGIPAAAATYGGALGLKITGVEKPLQTSKEFVGGLGVALDTLMQRLPMAGAQRLIASTARSSYEFAKKYPNSISAPSLAQVKQMEAIADKPLDAKTFKRTLVQWSIQHPAVKQFLTKTDWGKAAQDAAELGGYIAVGGAIHGGFKGAKKFVDTAKLTPPIEPNFIEVPKPPTAAVMGKQRAMLPEVRAAAERVEAAYSPESYQRWWEERQKTPVEQRLDYEDWWRQNTPEPPPAKTKAVRGKTKAEAAQSAFSHGDRVQMAMQDGGIVTGTVKATKTGKLSVTVDGNFAKKNWSMQGEPWEKIQTEPAPAPTTTEPLSVEAASAKMDELTKEYKSLDQQHRELQTQRAYTTQWNKFKPQADAINSKINEQYVADGKPSDLKPYTDSMARQKAELRKQYPLVEQSYAISERMRKIGLQEVLEGGVKTLKKWAYGGEYEDTLRAWRKAISERDYPTRTKQQSSEPAPVTPEPTVIQGAETPAVGTGTQIPGTSGKIHSNPLEPAIVGVGKSASRAGKDTVGHVHAIVEGAKSLVNLLNRGGASESAGTVSRAVEGVSGVEDWLRARLSFAGKDRMVQAAGIFHTDKEFVDFLDRLSKGESQPNPKMQALADQHNQWYQDVYTQDKARFPDMGFVNNYVPENLLNSKNAYNYVQSRMNGIAPEYISGSPMRGWKITRGLGFLERRGPDDYWQLLREMIDRGYKLKTRNIEEMHQVREYQSIKAQLAQKVLLDGIDSGAFVPTLKNEPGVLIREDMSKLVPQTVLDEAAKRIYGQDIPQGSSWKITGDPNAISSFNNYYSPGLRGTPVSSLYSGAEKLVGNAVHIKLFFPLRHAVTETLLAPTRALGQVVQSLTEGVTKGQLGDVLRANPVSLNLVGHALRKSAVEGSLNNLSPELRYAIEHGMKVGTDQAYGRQWFNEAQQHAAAGETVHTLGKGIMGVATEPNQEVFSKYIPNMKVALTVNRARVLLQQVADGKLTQVEADKLMSRNILTTDALMGRVNFTFWHLPRELLDGIRLAFPTLGWKGGTEILKTGATVDTVRQASALVQGKWRELPPELQRFGDRQSAVAAQLLATAAMGGTMHWLMTGRRPHTINDYLHPATGENNPDGSAERINVFMTYPSKDWSTFCRYFFTHDPSDLLTGPTEALVGGVSPIRETSAALSQTFGAPPGQKLNVAKRELGGVVRPLITLGAPTHPGTPTGLKILGALGATKARQEFTRSPAQTMMARMVEAGSPAFYNEEISGPRGQLRELIRETPNSSEIQKMITAGLKEKWLTPDALKRMRSDRKYTWNQLHFRRLNTQAQRDAVWKIMTPKERTEVVRWRKIGSRGGSSSTINTSTNSATSSRISTTP